MLNSQSFKLPPESYTLANKRSSMLQTEPNVPLATTLVHDALFSALFDENNARSPLLRVKAAYESGRPKPLRTIAKYFGLSIK